MSAQRRTQPRNVQRGQWLLFSAVAGVVVVLLAVLWMGAGGGNNAPPLRGIEAELAGSGRGRGGLGAAVRDPARRDRGAAAGLWRPANRRLQEENLQPPGTAPATRSKTPSSMIDLQAAQIEATLTAGSGATPDDGKPASSPFGPSDALRPAVAPVPATDTVSGNGTLAGALSGPLRAGIPVGGTFAGRGTGVESHRKPIPDGPKPTADYVPAGSYAEAVVHRRRRHVRGRSGPGRSAPGADPRLTSPAYGAAVDGVASRSDGCRGLHR